MTTGLITLRAPFSRSKCFVLYTFVNIPDFHISFVMTNQCCSTRKPWTRLSVTRVCTTGPNIASGNLTNAVHSHFCHMLLLAFSLDPDKK